MGRLLLAIPLGLLQPLLARLQRMWLLLLVVVVARQQRLRPLRRQAVPSVQRRAVCGE
jgi:hypothetical protein